MQKSGTAFAIGWAAQLLRPLCRTTAELVGASVPSVVKRSQRSARPAARRHTRRRAGATKPRTAWRALRRISVCRLLKVLTKRSSNRIESLCQTHQGRKQVTDCVIERRYVLFRCATGRASAGCENSKQGFKNCEAAERYDCVKLTKTSVQAISFLHKVGINQRLPWTQDL
jgi:hypothetical protein